MNPTRRNATVAAAILAAGIGGTLLGLTISTGPTVTAYEDGSVVIDQHNDTEPLVAVVPGSDAATD